MTAPTVETPRNPATHRKCVCPVRRIVGMRDAVGESWIVSNLNAALSTWNGKLAEIWSLLTESPQTFKGGQVWGVMTGIHGALQAIGYGLLVLFFAVGVMKTCGSFVEVKKPEHALKLFIRFALAKGAVTYGL